MKALFITLLVSLINVSYASEPTEFSADARILLSIAAKCPVELEELSESGMPTRATRISVEDKDVTTIEFKGGGYAPIFQFYEIGKLVITKTFQRSTLPMHIPDAPGGTYVYSCEIVK